MKHSPETHHNPQVTAVFGFWVYLMTDCVLFASLFAAYAVLHNSTFGGPSGQQLFYLPSVLTETYLLLTSSFTCGLGMLAVHRQDKNKVMIWFILTLLLGLAFLGMEINEFHQLILDGNGFQKSAFLSAFFTLVGTHGLHITFGSIWLIVLMGEVWFRGLTTTIIQKLTCLSLFWHFLDIVWIFIFTIVYLRGAL